MFPVSYIFLRMYVWCVSCLPWGSRWIKITYSGAGLSWSCCESGRVAPMMMMMMVTGVTNWSTNFPVPCHMGSHIVTCRPVRDDIPAFTSQLRLVLDLVTMERCDAELRPSWLGFIVPRWYNRPKTVTHPITNRAQRRPTSFMRRTTLPRRQTAIVIAQTHGHTDTPTVGRLKLFYGD